MICFSLPLLLDRASSGLGDALQWMARGAVGGWWVSSLDSDRMETKDSTLAERPGTSLQLGLDLVRSIVGVVV